MFVRIFSPVRDFWSFVVCGVFCSPECGPSVRCPGCSVVTSAYKTIVSSNLRAHAFLWGWTFVVAGLSEFRPRVDSFSGVFGLLPLSRLISVVFIAYFCSCSSPLFRDTRIPCCQGCGVCCDINLCDCLGLAPIAPYFFVVFVDLSFPVRPESFLVVFLGREVR